MTEMYNAILNGVDNSQQPQPQIQPQIQPHIIQEQVLYHEVNQIEQQHDVAPNTLFDVNDFITNLSNNSEKRNREIHQNSISINSYDVASNCIREVLFKLLNYPVESYKSVWLPVTFRSYLGNAVHDFIQDNSKVFTETECSLKVPSIRTSVRLDCLINHNVLVEIKSLPYNDYIKMINSRTPRIGDFYQTVFYRWMLHNHLKEAQEQPRKNLRSNAPKLASYNIDKIQFIYIAHDISSSEHESMSSTMKNVAHIRRLLESKKNPFSFIHVLTLDLNAVDVASYENYVVEKLDTINYHLSAQTIPTKDSKFVKDSCFFCLYKNVCKNV